MDGLLNKPMKRNFNIGNLVCRKDMKPFQNKRTVLKIVEFILQFEFDKHDFTHAVFLEGCEDPVKIRELNTEEELFSLIANRRKR